MLSYWFLITYGWFHRPRSLTIWLVSLVSVLITLDYINTVIEFNELRGPLLTVFKYVYTLIQLVGLFTSRLHIEQTKY